MSLVVTFLMPGKIRTFNPQIRSLILYPVELQAQKRLKAVYTMPWLTLPQGLKSLHAL